MLKWSGSAINGLGLRGGNVGDRPYDWDRIPEIVMVEFE